MFGLGAGELLIIFVFALIFIGPKKLPELARGLGKGIREFQKAKDEMMDHVNNMDSDKKEISSSSTEALSHDNEGEAGQNLPRGVHPAENHTGTESESSSQSDVKESH